MGEYMHIRKTVAALVASLSLGLPFASVAQGREPLKANQALIGQEMVCVCCIRKAEDIYFKPRNMEAQGITRNFLIDYCGQTIGLADSLTGEFTDIFRLDSYKAILALRAVPAEQKS